LRTEAALWRASAARARGLRPSTEETLARDAAPPPSGIGDDAAAIATANGAAACSPPARCGMGLHTGSARECCGRARYPALKCHAFELAPTRSLPNAAIAGAGWRARVARAGDGGKGLCASCGPLRGFVNGVQTDRDLLPAGVWLLRLPALGVAGRQRPIARPACRRLGLPTTRGSSSSGSGSCRSGLAAARSGA
jgi:hypothetical protein